MIKMYDSINYFWLWRWVCGGTPDVRGAAGGAGVGIKLADIDAAAVSEEMYNVVCK